jgi:peptidoglycan/xylan/chitin deacetylase (PgdA/CDA1 family)
VTIPVLLYHAVDADTDPRFAEWAVTPGAFAAHMDLVAASGRRAMTVSALVDAGMPSDAVAVTFDDGFADFHRHAWPALAERGLPATMYVTTGFVGATSDWLAGAGEGDRPLMDWDQIAEVAAAGIEIGGHGHTHVQLDVVSPATAVVEIARSRNLLAETVGPVRTFAYPHGYHHRRVRRQVEDAGYDSACAVGDGLAQPGASRFAIPRVIVREDTDLERVLAGAGAVPGARHVRRGAWRIARRAGAEKLRVPA